ncbi:RDD family protein [Psychroflexus sp. ALD_RP9]|uniref:RDD family protein n=1 Tax=Psychroflexus sp. ALD_RP9 TaxID=2777186 RepID=UPI001A8C0382|nr:RDD family protein [Psychroflexus sp. ALD_RP9]QSS96662.1 RDD family protein [Psychroflexus sp. ALD_RP9]
MKISELTEFRKVNRPTKKIIDGKRVYEKIEFELKYDPNIKNDSYRLFAKILDILIGIIILYFLVKNDIIKLTPTIYFLPVFLIFLNSVLETILGSSIGKLILWIEVVNDKCEHLNLLKSIERNFYSFLLFFSFPILRSASADTIDYYDKKMKEKHIYFISKREKRKIKAMLNKKTLPNNVYNK